MVVTCCHPRGLEQDARDFIQFLAFALCRPAIAGAGNGRRPLAPPAQPVSPTRQGLGEAASGQGGRLSPFELKGLPAENDALPLEQPRGEADEDQHSDQGGSR